MDLKIDFGTEEKDAQNLNLFVTIKYDDQTEQIPLNKTVAKNDYERNTEELQGYLKTVRIGLNEAIKHLKQRQTDVTVTSIKDTFLEMVA